MPIEILDTMQEEYERRSKNDPKLGEIRKQIKNGATYREAESYGTRSGEILSDVLQINITEDVFNRDTPLEDLIVPMMRTNYEKVVSATSAVQSSLNKSANINIKPIVPGFNEEEAVNLVTKMLSYDSFEEAEWLLGEPIVTNSLGVVTDMLHANADFQYKSGMSPKIVRTAESDCCKWCAELEGVYEYRELSSNSDVWKRHANCRCEVTYVPGDGRVQDVWNKQYLADQDDAQIRRRKLISEKLSNVVQTGGSSGAKKTTGWEERHAIRYYAEIEKRKPMDDAKRIVSNISESGFTVDDIEKIREHIFINEQPRDGTLKKFDADYDIAQAWQRLTSGKNIRESDIVLLKHELLELQIMEETGCTYEEAHDIAQKEYNWVEALKKEKK